MDVSQEAAQLLENPQFLQEVPPEVVDFLQKCSNTLYLDAIVKLALDPKLTSAVFVTHEPIFVELCSRWLGQRCLGTNSVAVLAALARVLPAAPHLMVYAKKLLCLEETGDLTAFTSRSLAGLLNLPEQQLHDLLLALCRLLAFDNYAFGVFISPAQLQLLLKHSNRPIRYLAVRILCQYLHASDVTLSGMMGSYLGQDEIDGIWEGKMIDYAFFSLWEEKRIKDLQKDVASFQGSRNRRKRSPRSQRIIRLSDLLPATAYIGEVLVPRLTGSSPRPSSLVVTKTVRQNMRLLAKSVNKNQPLMVTGFSGAGKTSLVRDLARELGKVSSMVTLHLNEQTDAKMLIGMYTSAKTPGSFSWQPGVLTTAVMEGRWVVIEDLDRAPTDIISTLLPLLERGELLIPEWGEAIRAAPGFKLISTVCSILNVRREEVNPAVNFIGFRNWLEIPLKMPLDEELGDMIRSSNPILEAYVPRIMKVYTILRDQSHSGVNGTRSALKVGRPQGPRDLFRWCGRLEDLLLKSGITSTSEPISETTNDCIFLEAVDCFAGMLRSGSAKSELVNLIARELHMSGERVQYCLEARKPDYLQSDLALRVGRSTIPKGKFSRRGKLSGQLSLSRPFALTGQVLRILESVAVAVKMAEPCLLVGETGTGKTTIIQQLAQALGHSLTVVNLSQQSEAGDLLGGYKPTNIRALAMPMKEEFDDLFEITFSTKRNQRYIEIVGKAVGKGRWAQALKLWQEALEMVGKTFGLVNVPNERSMEEPLAKKRKLESSKFKKLKVRWEKFASDVQTFQMHLKSGSKGFAFSFVEGNIVKAARNGDWVLLDEINLASQDTLESLADLLAHEGDDGPSLLLSETGDMERVYAHKDFRIFGAMNPATDVGKCDLPLNLRSRFTEIFLDSPDKDMENLTSVISAYLGNHNHLDLKAASDIAYLYFEIQELAEENRLVDGADQKPHFSLRTLTRTLSYVIDIAPNYGLRRALFEGFSMSFLTLLNKDSEILIQPLIDKYILGSQKNARALLRQLPRLPEDNKAYTQFRHYWIAQGAVPIQTQAHYIITPFVERNLLNLVRATSTRRFPVLLQGPTSSGKTSMVEYLAKISGNKFVRINNHEHTDLQEYLGTYISGPDGHLQYQEGILVRALREGSWIVLDELNLAPTDVLEALNRLLDDNRELLIPETQQVVRPHENFMLFATQNPPGMYGGRKVLSRAFRNRFLELHFDDIPEDELETILRERSQIAPSFCTKIVAVYRKLAILRQKGRLFEQKNSFATLRDLFRWSLRNADDREQLAINGFLLLAERVRNTEERLAVKGIIESVMNVKIDEDYIYSLARLRDLSGQGGPSSRQVIWTKSMRRLYMLVTQALRNNEPVLLVGETGCGKTTICQVIAEIMQTNLHIINAHQNLETGDLIGSQRPIRNRALIEAQLTQEVGSVLRECTACEPEPGTPLTDLLATFHTLNVNQPDRISTETRNRIEQLQSRSKALFGWSDGSLVHAMQTGQHFLLDEISLADDSVLERLNSVLEPDRTLLLAEKGTDDAFIVAAQGFQFLATMNPGGDYGKRELSPALRNRFTEIWVAQTLDSEEMVEIVQAKLSSSWSQFSVPMVTFAAWYGSRYNPAAPPTSIRDMLAWVQFVNNYRGSDQYFALLQGAAMVYIDGLGANPAAKTSIPEALIPVERDTCLTKLTELFEYDMRSVYAQRYSMSITECTLSIGPFSINKAKEVTMDSKYSLEAPTTKANVMKIIRALQLQKPILLEGNPGVGKTTLVTALAQSIGMPLTRFNLSEQTDLSDLFGSDAPTEGTEAGNFTWRDAPFLRAMQNGEWVLLDEMNLASQTVLEGLNACLDHRGQVYVSELDQTFSRHPDFVVFAAQNPHHQGGGRKGLPASFVNRFTVVFANTFTPEDLLMICRQTYPESSVEDTEKLTQCVTSLSHLPYHDRGFGSHGGPWEFNLRDVLRWLHLLTPSTQHRLTGTITDFQDIVILQRLRTPGDVVTVKNLLQQYLPKIVTSHSYFHNVSDRSIQIGLGLLERKGIRRAISSQQVDALKIDLPIAESVMICVQQNWPCLLVGPSGSGKTNTILQLASSVGADLVVLSMNAAMDTTDLVGGYGQFDPQRKITCLMNEMRNYVHTTIIQNLLSAALLSETLTALEQHLQATTVDLPVILRCVKELAVEYPSLEYARFAHECESINVLSAHDNKARFEWIDGILVKALIEGRWLVLDNANLCSPSVLDRLNSLLEPNGSLLINENRSPDGSARVIRPHPNFRLFLTMDPRHGELSRAMRNRSIELFMYASASSVDLDVVGSTCEPSLSRFKSVEILNNSTLNDINFHELLPIFLDHLSWSDYEMCSRWYKQVANGLIQIPVSNESRASSVLQLYHGISQNGGFVVTNIKEAYGKLAKERASIPDFGAAQNIHPLNNAVMVPYSIYENPSKNLSLLGTAFELLVDLSNFLRKLKSVEDSLESRSLAQMTRLERSLASSFSRTFKNDTTKPLGNLLRGMGTFMLNKIDEKDFETDIIKHSTFSFARDLLLYLSDIFDITQTRDFDEGAFQAYQTIGGLMAANVTNLEISSKSKFELAHELRNKLNDFNASWQLSLGLSMEVLWNAFRPPVPENLGQLEACLQVEGLGDLFDALMLTSGISLKESGNLRQSIVDMYSQLKPTDTQLDEQLEEVQNAIYHLESRSTGLGITERTYFCDQFEGLRQYETSTVNTISNESHDILDLLAERSSKDSMRLESSNDAYNALLHVVTSTGIDEPRRALVTLRHTLPGSTLHKIKNMTEVPLKSLVLLCEEVENLATHTALLSASIKLGPVQTLKKTLGELITDVLGILAADLHPQSLAKHRQYLMRISYGSSDAILDLPESHHLSKILKNFINPSLLSMQYVSDEGHESMANLASAFILFFTGFLVLYVPDRPFDPAIKPMVERGRHQKRRGELLDKLNALRGFGKIFSGQNASLRTQLVEKALKALGEEPQVAAIVRPRVSTLGQLQGELNNVHKSITSKSPDVSTLQLLFKGNVQVAQEIELLRSNIAQATARLTNSYRAYDDITKPAVAMLQGLDVGLAVALLQSKPTASRYDAIQSLCEFTPFFSLRPDYLVKLNSKDLSRERHGDPDLRRIVLQCFAATRSLGHDKAEISTRIVFEAFHASYEDWKAQLGEDHKREMAKSSMYRYRGGEEDNEEQDEKDFLSVFPNYEFVSLKESEAVKRRDDPSMLAQNLASRHREIFKHCESTSQYLLRMLQDTSGNIAGLWQDDSGKTLCPVPAADMMSGLVLNLEKMAEHLQGSSSPGKLYSFYTDANIVEARRIVNLVRKIQNRFADLKEAWPEHTTIQDVLRTSSELLDLRHTEPVAKILTKAEQVHGFIHEWQVVASREYSAAILYDEFTALLVDWRRLELSTWARLLDMEDKKCNDDADSWWFIAYEVIIAAPLSIIDSGTSLQGHTEQLFTTLGEFLVTTPQGQFSERLLLLECFVGHLKLLVQDLPAMKIVHTAVVNFLSYYRPFEKTIQDSLHKGRREIEKKMKELLLLASWKDTNITALRDSAKRSHHNLFKIIRKYRALLSQSAQNTITQGLPERQEYLGPSSHKAHQDHLTKVDINALELCRQYIRSWPTKPARFAKPMATAENMDLVTRIPSSAVESASLVETFANSLIENMKILQKGTPTTLTKQKAGLVRHLKSRKRNLFSSTLKGLRQMGFQSNLGADVLAKQESLSIVLANTPASDENLMGNDFSTAQYYFHKVLNIIPQAKELFRNHSNDLSPGEVARSIGYLQSILSIILKQRATSINYLQNLQGLDQTVQMMRNLWAPNSYMLQDCHATPEICANRSNIKRTVQWLPGILNAGCVIIEKHSKLGCSGSTQIVEGLQSWAMRMTNMNKDYETLPHLPINVSSSLHEKTDQTAKGLLNEIRHDLQRWADEATHIAFVLEQIRFWTETTQIQPQSYMNGEHPIRLEELDSNVSKAVDSILVAVQGVEKARFSMPSSDQDVGWLCRTDASLGDSLKMSHIQSIKNMFDDAMLQIHRVRTEDGRGLDAASAVFAMALPIVQQYRDIQTGNLDRYIGLHRSTCRLASVLAQSFSQVASEGFCMPSDKSAAESGRGENLEEGTGLGEGEGAEDISKDIKDDEDLSELAQEGQKSKDKEEIEDQENAVNMDHDELEGELGDAPDKGDESVSGSDREEKEMDDEIGDVDDLDPSAVDERLWDGGQEGLEKEKEGSKGTGEKRKDEQTAAQDGQREDANTEEAGDGDGVSQEGAEEGEDVAREEMEKIDPHLQEGQNLDLPEEMDLDSDNDPNTISEADDSNLDDLSDVVDQEEVDGEKAEANDEDVSGAEPEIHNDRDLPKENATEEDPAAKQTEDTGSPVDTEPETDEHGLDEGILRDKTSDMLADPADAAEGEANDLREGANQQTDQGETQDNRTYGSKGAKGNPSAHDDPQASLEDGQLGQAQESSENANGRDEGSNETSGNQAFKKLGDALEKWHLQRRQIRNAPDSVEDRKHSVSEVPEANQEFEHLQDEAAEADTQALGAATEDQAQALDKRALDAEMQDRAQGFFHDEDADHAEEEDDLMQDVDARPISSMKDGEQPRPGALIGPNNVQDRKIHRNHSPEADHEEDVEDLDTYLSATHLQAKPTTAPHTPEKDRRLWSHYETLTRSLSLSLTEQLRLILAPTLATRLRGDFRTGKRLNIKRIIPYIASQYKRDKIWMRRSVPSKRAYQIMLAVDDSKSMGESGSGQLAFETLALVSKSLSMLEVGEICVVGFGDGVNVAHEFDKPFSSDAGAHILEHFTFQQTTTNVRRLVSDSIALFRDARLKSRAAGADLWQLELIISDGVCEDHEGIRRLVRQAQEERIMMVFVIVDALQGESIMDMSQAVFESEGSAGGEQKLRIKRYLDGFPFGYYLVVGDVKELPGVLATALRQWFAEVVETG